MGNTEHLTFARDLTHLLPHSMGRLAADIRVHLPRPRVRTSPEFNTLEGKVLELLEEAPA